MNEIFLVLDVIEFFAILFIWLWIERLDRDIYRNDRILRRDILRIVRLHLRTDHGDD